ncbi:MAG: SRPBCC family protein [Pseudomonadota bacterium]|nr:MAG: SRPBCC family protein [Pseudomonadota bacterium]
MARKLFGVLLALVVAVTVIGFLLPAQVTVERSRIMDADPETVFEVLNDLRHFARWSPWLLHRSNRDFRLEGPPAGVGATLVWDEARGDGGSRMWIVESRRPERIEMRLELGRSDADGWFELESAEAGTEVQWGMRMSFGAFDLTGRYVGLMLPGLVGRDYSRGLERLERYLTADNGGPPSLGDDSTEWLREPDAP